MSAEFDFSEARVVYAPELRFKAFAEREMAHCVLLLEVGQDGFKGAPARFYRVPVECWGRLAEQAAGLQVNAVLRDVRGEVRSSRWVGKKDGKEHFDVVLKAKEFFH